MKNDDFENQLSRTPMRDIPAEWRAEILQAAAHPAQIQPATAPASLPQKSGWRDLLWPCPQAWAALACIWFGIFISSNIGAPSPRSTPVARVSAETLMVRLAQERTLAENRGAGL
jgi:hypothetical protein